MRKKAIYLHINIGLLYIIQMIVQGIISIRIGYNDSLYYVCHIG